MHDYKKLYEDLCKAIQDNTEDINVGGDFWGGGVVTMVPIQYLADEMETYNNSITK